MSTFYQINGYPIVSPIFDEIPDELKQQPFAVWKATPREGQPNKFNKVPCHPVTGRFLKTSEPDTWGSYEEAKAAFTHGGWSGVGLLLTGNGIVGFDIDDAESVFATQPEIKRWVIGAVKDGAYFEKSPSGNGYRGFVRGVLPESSKKRGNSLEIYGDVRFLTLTGHVVKLKEAA